MTVARSVLLFVLAALAEMAPGLGHLDEDDVAELPLREVGDADGRDITLDASPLMFPGVVDAHEPAPLR